jgi:uncharacterized protein YidB (DUF937 family)
MIDIGKVLGTLIGGSIKDRTSNPLSLLLGSLAGNSGEQKSNMLLSVMSLIQNNGGLGSVIGLLKQNGMSSQAESWVSSRPNENISSDQVQQVFGASLIGKVASQLGVDKSRAGSVLAMLLPELVNQLTPEGKLSGAQDDLIAKGLSLLSGKG